MQKEKIQELETKKPEDLRKEIAPSNLRAIEEVADSLYNHPELFYVDIDEKDHSITVRKRSDDSPIYETEDPLEVELLKSVGIKKKPE